MRPPRPPVTVTFAQSLDGSLAAETGQPLALSGPQALQFTHQLRAAHDAILIGIGTLLADNPRLTVRHAAGPNPQPIVLDSQLRFPLNANLLSHPNHAPWIVTTEAAPHERQAALEAAGARVLRIPSDAANAGRVALPALLDQLGALGVRSLMVEGGAHVITSFLAERLADRLIVTIAPRLIGGLRAISTPLHLSLHNVRYQVLGEDVLVEAALTPTPGPSPSPDRERSGEGEGCPPKARRGGGEA
jgi:3,4-dihydroxy 2-butanone 4-phosphate synthase/GTP cyclohydrolase II